MVLPASVAVKGQGKASQWGGRVAIGANRFWMTHIDGPTPRRASPAVQADRDATRREDHFASMINFGITVFMFAILF
jgi:hypothetical protein